MIDFQVVRLQDVLPITSITRLVGVSPRSVEILGSDFINVESVYLNDSLSPSIIVMSEKRILAQVPSDQVNETIRSAYVLSTRLSFTQRSLVELSIGRRPQKVSGVLMLVQNFVRILLRTPGTNIFNPNLGGGLFKSIGKNIGANSRDRVGSDIAVSVARTRQAFIAAQTPDRRIPPEERLLTADIIGLSVVPEQGTIYATISVKSQAGSSAAATIVR